MAKLRVFQKGPRPVVCYECVSLIALVGLIRPAEIDGLSGLALNGGGGSAAWLGVVGVACLVLWWWERRRQMGQSWPGEPRQTCGTEGATPPGADFVRERPSGAGAAG